MKRMTCKIQMRAMETKMKIELYEKPMIHKPCFFQNPRSLSRLLIFPRNFVWGSSFDSVSRSSSSSSRLLLQPHTPWSNTIFPTPSFTFHLSHTTLSTIIFHTLSFTHNFVKHHLSNTIFHIPTIIFHTRSFTHNFVKHHLSNSIFHTPSFTHCLSHTTLSNTIFQTASFTHPLSHPIFHTQLCQPSSFTHSLSHTTLSNTIFQIPSFTHPLCQPHPPSFHVTGASSFCVVGVALVDIHLR